MEMHDLEVLATVVEAGGFNRAAKRLLQTQSAVSQTIARMERRIGTALLVRSTPPKPTPAGRRVLEFAHRVFDDVQTLERDLADIQGQSIGRLKLGASQMVTNLHLTDLLTKFSASYAKASFDVVNVPSRELVLHVREERCEIGFGPLQREMPGLQCHPYYGQRMRLYAGKRHPAFDGLRDGDESTLKQAILITSYLDPIENRPNPRRLRYRFAGVWQIASLNLRVDLIAKGMGIGYLPEELMLTHPLGQELSPVSKFEYGTVERQIGIYYLSQRKLSPMGQLFVEFCDRQCSTQKSPRKR